MPLDVIPAVDVLDGAVVRLHRGDYQAAIRYGLDPVAQVQAFVAQGAGLVHVVDLDAARTGRPGLELWERLGALGVVIQAGGGVRTPLTAEQLVGFGIQRVVVGTAALAADEVLAAIVDRVGPEKVVGGLDVRDGRARGSGWTDEGSPLPDVIEQLVSAGVRRAIVTGIAADGTMAGPDLALLRTVEAAAPQMSLIASGGIGSLEHIAAVAATSCEGVIVGRALYEGRFTYSDALAASIS